LSSDGKNLAYRANRQGKFELWRTSLEDDRETLIGGDDFHIRDLPQWSRDGTHLAYWREKPATGERQLMDWSAVAGEETPITEPKKLEVMPFDWSPGDRSLLVTQPNRDNHRYEIWTVAVGPERSARKIASDPAYDLFQGHFSPDGRWIVFEATRPDRVESTIYAMATTGGQWVPSTDGRQWDDKPRWSPDGKTIYYLSGRNGFYNVYGIRFDPIQGNPFGSPFPVTEFRSPSAMIPKEIMGVELAIAKDRLIVNVEQLSGSIWVLDNVDR
jgi:Tol biopolymer transport system component